MKLSKLLLEEKEFELPKLKYSYDALEPHIDKDTMVEHHSKHMQGYVNKLNDALDKPVSAIRSILENIDQYDSKVRNNAGGVFNHNVYFNLLSPTSQKTPVGELKLALEQEFDSFEKFKEEFKEAGLGQFGSGWAWLVVNESGLKILSTPNQDNPIMSGEGEIVIGMDVWEHSYYLKHKSKRGDYIDDFFKVLCWDSAESRYQQIING
jgi:Fe-Mn family superoxide dismutase